ALPGRWTTTRATNLDPFRAPRRTFDCDRRGSFCTVRLISLILLGLALVPQAQGADGAISFLENRVKDDPDDFVAQNQLASRYLDLLRVTGDDAYLARAHRAAEASVASGVPELNNGGLAALAGVQLAAHQFAAARDPAK